MSENPEGPAVQPDKARSRPPKLILIGVAVAAVAAVLYAAAMGFKPGAHGLAPLATGAMAKLELPKTPQVEPDAGFFGPAGQTMHLQDFKGQVLVVNFWATWCAPCVEEMPTLAKLQAAYAGQPVKVVAISLDRTEDTNDAKRFINKHGPLDFYQDPKYDLPFSLNPRPAGVPTTVIYDRQGHEQARLSGGADWASPEAKAIIDQVLKTG